MIATTVPPRRPAAFFSSRGPRHRGEGHAGLSICATSRSSSRGATNETVESISSPSNPFVKHCVKLRTSSSYRHSRASALVVGLTPISEIMRFQTSNGKAGDKLGLPLIDCLLLLDGEEVPVGLCDHTSHVVHVNTSVMKKLTGLINVDSTEAVAVMRFPDSFCDLDSASGLRMTNWLDRLPSANRVLVLDGVQDPGNLGTLIRSAMAFKWDIVFLLPGCCDPFNEKALRAARGASFQIPTLSGSWSHLEELRDRFQMKMLAAHPAINDQQSSAVSILCREFVDELTNKPLCLILGSEGHGISEQTRYHSNLVSIPMAGQFESLNVSVAGGIFLYMLQNQRLF